MDLFSVGVVGINPPVSPLALPGKPPKPLVMKIETFLPKKL